MAFGSGFGSGFGGGFGGFSSYGQRSSPPAFDRRARLAQLTPEERNAIIEQIRSADLQAPPAKEPTESFVGALFPDIVEDAATQIGKSLLYTPVGLYEMGKAAVQDATDMGVGGSLLPERTLEVAEAIPRGIAEDFRHPRENIGYLLMDVASLASLGAGTAVRAGAGARAVRALRGGPPPPPAPIGFRRPPPQGPGPINPLSEEFPTGRPHSGYPEDIADLPAERSSFPPLSGEDLRGGPLSREMAIEEAKRFSWRMRNMDEYQMRSWAREMRRRGWSFEVLQGASKERALAAGGEDWIIRRPKDGRKGIESTPLERLIDERKAQPQAPVQVPHHPVQEPPITPDELSRAKQAAGLKDPRQLHAEARKAAEVEEPQPYSTPDDLIKPEAELPPAPSQFRLVPIKQGDPSVLGVPGTPWSMVFDRADRTWQIHKKGKAYGPKIGDPEGAGDVTRATQTARDNLFLSMQEEAKGAKSSLRNPPEEQAGPPTELAQKVDAEEMTRRLDAADPEDALLAAIEKKRLETDAPGPISPAAEELQAEAKQAAKRRQSEIPPSARNVSTRALGVSDRALGINPRALRSQMPDVPEDVKGAIAHDLRMEARTTGKPPTGKREFEILKQHLGDEKLAKEVMKRRREIRGGANIPIETYIRTFYQAFKAPRTGGFLRMENYSWTGRVDEARRMRGDPHLQAYALLSKNPIVAAIQKAAYAGQKRLARSDATGAKTLERLLGGGRDLEGWIKFHNKEARRIVDAAETAGIPQSLRDAAREAYNQERTHGLGEYVDTMNQFAKIGALYLKPAYLPANMLGQIFLSMVDHSWNPVNVARAVKIQRQLFSKQDGRVSARAQKIRQVMGEGIAHSMHYETGASRKVGAVYRYASEAFNEILDTPFRDNAFINEAFRHGYRDVKSIERLIDAAPGTAEYQTLLEVGRRANRNLIDYARLGSAEKRFIRRVIFFYPWFKGATIYGGKFFSEHPAQALVMSQQGQAAYESDPVGGPSYMEGFIPLGEKTVPGIGRVGRAINPTAASVLGTPGEVLNTVRGAISGSGGRADKPSSFLTPAVSAGIAALTGTDPFTGRDYPAGQGAAEIFTGEIADTIAPYRLWQQLARAREIESGETDPSDVLYLRSRGEALGQFFGGVTPVSYNVKEARERAAAESRSLETKRRRTELGISDKQKLWDEESRRIGMGAAPETVRDAFRLKSRREGEYAAVEVQLGRKLRQIDRLQADMSLMVRAGQIDEEQARRLLLAYAALDDNTISSLRREIGERYFGGAILSTWASAIRARGGEIPDL